MAPTRATADRFNRLGITALFRAHRLATRWLEEALGPLGISMAEFRLVGAVLGSQHGVSQKELADRLRISAATVSVAVARLETKGVVERVADEIDSRVKRVRCAEGFSTDESFQVLKALERRALRGVSQEDRAAMRRVHAQIAENLK